MDEFAFHCLDFGSCYAKSPERNECVNEISFSHLQNSLFSLQIQHQPIASYYYSLVAFDGRNSVHSLLKSYVAPRVEVGESQPFRPGPQGDIGSILRVEVRPLRILLTGLVGALRDEQVGILGQMDRVIADACIRAVGYGLAVQIEAVAQTGRGVHQKLALHGKGHLVRPGRELAHFYRIGQLFQGNGERLVDNSIQDRFGALLAEDLQALRETELVQDMQALDVVQMEVAEEEVDRQVIMDVAVGPVDAVARVQDDMVFTGVDEGADGVAGIAVVPAVGAEKDDVHFFHHVSDLQLIRSWI